MIDHEARKIAVHLLGEIETTRITNWQLEDKWPESDSDPGINCIQRWIWSLYDDGKEEAIIDKMSKENIIILNRCIDFMKSDIEFPTKDLSQEESRVVKKKWGVEWRTDCTCPTDFDSWPFPPDN
jgi:hypothetical protein